MYQRTPSRLQWIATVGMGAFYILAGVNHFWDEAFYVRLMPPYVPAHTLMVQLSGLAEIALGVGVMLPPTRRWAAFGVIVLLIAVFPANVHVALNNVAIFEDAAPMPLVNWIRLPVQLVFIFWAWKVGSWTVPMGRAR
jgi:uncharacterized membrane protein